ncbi:hypothetical protein Aduo_008544 [Ancylostoma duodenale]
MSQKLRTGDAGPLGQETRRECRNRANPEHDRGLTWIAEPPSEGRKLYLSSLKPDPSAFQLQAASFHFYLQCIGTELGDADLLVVQEFSFEKSNRGFVGVHRQEATPVR